MNFETISWFNPTSYQLRTMLFTSLTHRLCLLIFRRLNLELFSYSFRNIFSVISLIVVINLLNSFRDEPARHGRSDGKVA